MKIKGGLSLSSGTENRLKFNILEPPFFFALQEINDIFALQS